MTFASEGARNSDIPRWVWWASVAGTALVAVAVGVAALALGLGAADPAVAGPVVWSDDALHWAAGPVAPPALETGAWWTAPEVLPHGEGPFTLSVQATLLPDADALDAWGVWVAGVDGMRTLYALSAGGYWTIRTCPRDAATMIIEDCPAPAPEWRWLAYPHIRPAGEQNTITLHREASGALRLRINKERLGAPVVLTSGEWGVWARGGVAWESASLAVAR